MAKKTPDVPNMRELDEIKVRLSEQDKVLREQTETLKQIFWTLKGSVSLGLEGLMPTMDALEKTVEKMDDSMRQIISDVAHLQAWKSRIQRGDLNVNIPTTFKSFAQFLGWAIALGLTLYTIFVKH